MLAEAWVVPHPLQLFRGLGGKASPFPPPPLVYTEQCTVYGSTMKLPNFPNFQSNANKYAIDPYCISTREGGKLMRVVLTCHESNR